MLTLSSIASVGITDALQSFEFAPIRTNAPRFSIVRTPDGRGAVH